MPILGKNDIIFEDIKPFQGVLQKWEEIQGEKYFTSFQRRKLRLHENRSSATKVAASFVVSTFYTKVKNVRFL